MQPLSTVFLIWIFLIKGCRCRGSRVTAKIKCLFEAEPTPRKKNENEIEIGTDPGRRQDRNVRINMQHATFSIRRSTLGHLSCFSVYNIDYPMVIKVCIVLFALTSSPLLFDNSAGLAN